MFDNIASRIPRDRDLPDRVWDIEVRKRLLDGSFYGVLPYEYYIEYVGQTYIPIHERRPAVQYGLLRSVVLDSVALLFGASHFPTVDCEDRVVRDTVSDLIAETRLSALMSDAAIRGSVGSIVVRMRVLRQRVFFDILDTQYLNPTYDPEEPDTLLVVTERRKVSGESLRDAGYKIDDDDLRSQFWWRVDYTKSGEDHFVPLLVSDQQNGVVQRLDRDRSVHHGLGFVPMVWIRNLPGHNGNTLDGACTFEAAITYSVDIDYSQSQMGRAFRYAADPLLVLRNPSTQGDLFRSASTALTLDKDGDAKLLEMSGSAAKVQGDHVRTERELALESVRGNRASPERLTSAQSGRSLELMNQPLISLADDLRLSYGDAGLLPLMQMFLKAATMMPIRIRGKIIPKMDPSVVLSLRWRPYFTPSSEDMFAEANTLAVLTKESIISRETAMAHIASVYSINDLPAELARITADQVARLAEIPEAGRQLRMTD